MCEPCTKTMKTLFLEEDSGESSCQSEHKTIIMKGITST